MQNRREFLTGLARAAGGIALTSLSPIEVLAQEANQKIDVLWGHGDFFVKEVYSDGIVFRQQAESANPDYVVEVEYAGKEGGRKLLTDWTLVASVYAKSDAARSRPLYRLKTSGRTDAENKFKMEDAKIAGDSELHSLPSPSFTAAVLWNVSAGNPEQVSGWITDISKKYEALKTRHKTLNQMPSDLYK